MKSGCLKDVAAVDQNWTRGVEANEIIDYIFAGTNIERHVEVVVKRNESSSRPIGGQRRAKLIRVVEDDGIVRR